jgi:Lrp/AsnC family transcriptional regulator for asnA, asnC and gidA
VTTLKLEPVDVRIVRCLGGDARISVAKIAARLRMPESTVRHRLNRLVRSGAIEFATVTNPLRFGYHVWVMIEIQAELSKIRSVAQCLANIQEIYFVGITTGSYDVLAKATFRSNEELLDFISTRLARIPGVIRASTSSILDVVKRTVTYGLPPRLDGNSDGSRVNSVRPSRRRRGPL